MRAMSRSRVTALPSLLTMMSPNSSSVCRRPCALTESCRSMRSGAGRGADDAGRGLHVLLADGAHHVARRQVALGDLARIEPHAHRVVAAAPHQHLAHALDARQAVLDVEHAVVAQVRHVVALARRDQVHHHGQVDRALHRGDAEAAHLLGQARLGLVDAVLHQLLREIRVGADLERDGERHACRRWSPGCSYRACSRRR